MIASWKDPRKESPVIPEGKYGISVIVVQYDPIYNENPRNPLTVTDMSYSVDKGFIELDHEQIWQKPADPVILWDYKPEVTAADLDKIRPINIEAYGIDFK